MRRLLVVVFVVGAATGAADPPPSGWYDAATGGPLTAGWGREPAFEPSPTPAQVCFYVRGVLQRCDSTPDPFQSWSPVHLNDGDEVRAVWAGGSSTHLVGQPTTTTTPPTTTPPTTTPAPPATTVPTAGFAESFDGDGGLDRFVWGVYHRNIGAEDTATGRVVWGDNNAAHGASWTGDHDLDCGPVTTQRPLASDKEPGGPPTWQPDVDFHLDELVYTCRDHLMTSMGDADGYSIVWFSPDRVFASVSSVSFAVNLTDLGPRQWWKVGVVAAAEFDRLQTPVGSRRGPVAGHVVSDLGVSDVGAPLATADRLVATWGGQGSGGYPGGLLKVGDTVTGIGANPTPGDKTTRHPVTLVDSGAGTVTFTVAGVAATVAGAFPDCPCRVVFYDHNYTPDKDGPPVGHTWHWDDIAVG